MTKILNDVKFDFSEYYGKKNIMCFLNINENEIIKNIIGKFLGENISENPPIFLINERKIDENLSFKDNNIKEGETISIYKEKKGIKEIIIKNERTENKHLPIINFIETQRENTNASLRKYKGKEVKKEKKIYKYNFKKKKTKRNIKNYKCFNPFRKFKNWKLNVLFLFILFIFIIAFILLYFLLNKSNKKKNFIEEKLISNLDYKENQIYNLLNKKEYGIIFGLKNMDHIPYENRTYNFTQYIHYTLGIEKQDYEIDEKTKEKKYFYNAFLLINNITFENDTDIVINLYFNHINKAKNLRYLKKLKKLRYLNEKQISVIINEQENLIQPIISFEFYKNGEIKQKFFPKDLENTLFEFLNEFIENFIPILKEDSYCKNITEELNKMKKEEVDEEEISEDDYLIRKYNRRRLKNKERKVTKYKIISIEKPNYNKDKIRRMNSNKNKSEYFIDNYTKEIEFIDSDEDENKVLELREYNIDKNNNNNDSHNSSNINQHKESLANIQGQNLKNSNKIISTHMEINEELGLINLVNIVETVKLNTNSEEEDELNSKKVINSKNEINEYSLNTLEDEISDNKTSKEEKINTNFDSKFDTMLYTINNSIVNKDKFININEKRVKILKEEFNKYQYNLYNQTDYGNKTMRILNSLSKYVSKQSSIEQKIIVEDIPIEEYKKQKKNSKIRKLLENPEDIYYGLKNVDITKNAYKSNILGLKLEGNLENKINQREGTTTSSYHSYFGNTKISYNVGDIETNLHIITKNINEMTKDYIYLINNSLENLVKRSEKYAEIILNLENNISEIISGKNLYDFSKILKSPLDEMYNKVKNLTNILFEDLILLIEQSHKNYTLLQIKIINNNLNSFKQIKEITKNEYIEYINSSINNLEIFSNKTLEYIRILENITKNINSFTIDILYDIIDNIEEAEIIFKNFCYFLFNSISKGIKFFKNKLNYHIEETIGELLYIVDFISNGLKNDNILMNAIDEKRRNNLIIKLKDFRKIINIIINSIIEDISNDYFYEMLYSNPKSAKSLTESKSLQLLTNIQNNSYQLISSIKLKILFIEKYELYSFNIDQINNINYNIQNNFYKNTYEKIIKEFIYIKPQFLDESSKIIENKNKLFNLSAKIKNVINNEINEINNYIDIYSNKYKDENIYNLSINLYYFSKSFLEKSMKELLNDFVCLINDTISINLKSIIKYNYDLGFQYLNEEKGLFETYKNELNLWDKAMNSILSGKLKLAITNKFISKSTKYLEYTKNFISLVQSEELLNIFEKYFYYLKDEILNYVKNKLLLINKYYFESEQYSNNFHFISQVLNEILRQIDNINKYYNDETFDGKLKFLIITLIQNILIDYDAKLQESFDTSFQSLIDRTDSIKDKDFDFCKIKRRFIFFKKTRCYYTEHTNNLNLLVNNLIHTEIYIKDYKNKIFAQFTNKFEKYLDNIINISNRLYNNLYMFTEEKIKNNKNLEIIISDYHNIVYNMINVNSNKNLLNEIYFINQNEKIKNNSECILNEIENGLKKIKSEYYKIYYINNKTEFLEFPYEILLKCNQILNELNNSKDYIKSSINFIYKERVKNIIKETNLFIKDINDNNFLYIISHLNLIINSKI